MDDEPPDILCKPLEFSKEQYQSLITWSEGFENYNSYLNHFNSLEYTALCKAIKHFCKNAESVSNQDPKNFLKGDRMDIVDKRYFAKEAKQKLEARLSSLEGVFEKGLSNKSNEETHIAFTVPNGVFKLDTSGYDGYLDMDNATPD